MQRRHEQPYQVVIQGGGGRWDHGQRHLARHDTILTPKLEAAFRKMAGEKSWAAADAPWAEIERAVLPNVFEVPTGTVGQPEDIGRAVAFLCSPLAGYITGIDLHIDGGAMPAL